MCCHILTCQHEISRLTYNSSGKGDNTYGYVFGMLESRIDGTIIPAYRFTVYNYPKAVGIYHKSGIKRSWPSVEWCSFHRTFQWHDWGAAIALSPKQAVKSMIDHRYTTQLEEIGWRSIVLVGSLRTWSADHKKTANISDLVCTDTRTQHRAME